MPEEAAAHDSPYRGLMPYSEKDAPFFFGRDSERRIITNNLRGSRFTLLYGPTGVGKSSVLRAGVAYHLRKLARENIAEGGIPEFIVTVFDSWRDDPVKGLAECVRASVKEIGLDAEIHNGQSQHSLPLLLKSYSDRFNSDLLIILDQFEEYFIYHPQESDKGTFASEFPRLVNRPDLRISFLISIREDALSRLDAFKGRIPNLFDNYLRIEHLGEQAARDAIEKPVKAFNQIQGTQYSIGKGLVAEVCKQVRADRIFVGQVGRGVFGGSSEKRSEEARIETHFLQMVMTRLWEQEIQNGSSMLRLKTLIDLGGADEIVRTHLDKEMNKLSRDEQATATNLFRYLVTPTGTKIALTADDLAGYTDLPEERLSKVLNHLSKPEIRIIRPVRPLFVEHHATRYEIFHDVLAPAILDWRSRHIEQNTKKRFKMLLYAFLSFLVIVLVILVVKQINDTRRAKIEAERAKEEAELNLRSALELMSKQDRSAPYFKAIMRGHNKAVNSAAVSPDGRVAATASNDNAALVWDIESGIVIFDLRNHTGAVKKIAFSPDGKLLVTASEDKTACIWDADTGRLSFQLSGHTEPLSNAVFSPNGNLVVTSSKDGTARLWEVTTGKVKAILTGHTGAINDARFDLVDGRYVVTASEDLTARIWTTKNGESVGILKGHKNTVNTAAFSPDGNYVLTASADGNAIIWRVDGMQNIVTLGHSGGVNAAAFSNDSSMVVTAGEDNIAKVWEAKTRVGPSEGWQFKRSLVGHQGKLLSAVFSADGKRVITASADQTARVWDPLSGNVLFELRGHSGQVNTAVFTPAGDLAISAGEDTTARVWNVPVAPTLRVTEVSMQIVPKKHNGLCPIQIRLIGKITVEGRFGQVEYRFVRKNGSPGAEKTLNFSSPGTKEVSAVYKFGGRAFPNVFGTFYLEVLSPQTLQSDEVDFSVRCNFPSDNEDKADESSNTSAPPIP